MRFQLTFDVENSLLGVGSSLLPLKVSFIRSPIKRDNLAGRNNTIG